MHSSRAGGARAWERRTSIVLATGAFLAVGTIVDDLIARERNPSQLDGGIYLFVWGVSTGLPTNFGGALHREHRSIVRPVEMAKPAQLRDGLSLGSLGAPINSFPTPRRDCRDVPFPRGFHKRGGHTSNFS